MAALLSVDEARQKILARISPVGELILPISSCYQRVLAQEIRSGSDWPPFANSSMDGFAVRSDDVMTASLDRPVILTVVTDIPAGKPSQIHLEAGKAARIMTGAEVPRGADSIVPIEDTNFSRQSHGVHLPESVEIHKPAARGAFIRSRGQDISTGQVVLQPGRRLQPQDIGILAQLGLTSIKVYRKPKVALLATGDELLTPDQTLEPGKIRDSNSYTLAGLLTRDGAEVIPLGIARDDFETIQERMDQAVREKVDLIITSAGVSVGAYDYVRAVVESAGQLEFWRVNMRPGKPVAFGSYRGIQVIGLPGNPVSAFVTYEVLARPVVIRLGGINEYRRLSFFVRLEEPIESDGRESYLRGIVNNRKGNPTIRLTGHQGSGNLFSLTQANALLIVPSGVKSLPAGSEVEVWLLETEVSV